MKEEVCVECGAEVSAEKWSGRTHCNGQRFESRTFLCGRVIEWVPNFENFEVETYCKNTPKYLACEKANKEAFQKLAVYVKKLPGLNEKSKRSVLIDIPRECGGGYE